MVLLCLHLDVFKNLSEKAMAPHSSTLAWKIPWMEEPGRLKSSMLMPYFLPHNYQRKSPSWLGESSKQRSLFLLTDTNHLAIFPVSQDLVWLLLTTLNSFLIGDSLRLWKYDYFLLKPLQGRQKPTEGSIYLKACLCDFGLGVLAWLLDNTTFEKELLIFLLSSYLKWMPDSQSLGIFQLDRPILEVGQLTLYEWHSGMSSKSLLCQMNVLYWWMHPGWPQQSTGFQWKSDSYPYAGKHDFPLCCLSQIRVTDFFFFLVPQIHSLSLMPRPGL